MVYADTAVTNPMIFQPDRASEYEVARLNIGVIGYGYWGPNLVRNFQELPSTRVAMVADLNPKMLVEARRHYRELPITTTDYRQVLESQVDAVVIATPVSSHFRLAKEALLMNKHVLVEKPLTRSSQEAQELTDLAAARGLILMVGHTFEYNPAVELLKQIITSGEIGDVQYISTTRTNLGLFKKDINVIWDLAPHDFSILLFMLGAKPLDVSATGAACVQPRIHDVARMTVNFEGGIQAHIHVSWLDPCKVRRVTVVGNKKMVVYDDIEAQEKIRIYDKGVELPERTANYGEFQLSYRYGGITIPRVPLNEPLTMECAHFADCILNHQTPRSSGAVGVRVVKMLECADSSLQAGGVWVPFVD